MNTPKKNNNDMYTVNGQSINNENAQPNEILTGDAKITKTERNVETDSADFVFGAGSLLDFMNG